jgi:ABC-type Zn uptake system ZnuABC Zn-binding protein ZnuA
MMRFGLVLLFLMTALSGAVAAPLKVVASFSVLGDMPAVIAGDRAAITTSRR